MTLEAVPGPHAVQLVAAAAAQYPFAQHTLEPSALNFAAAHAAQSLPCVAAAAAVFAGQGVQLVLPGEEKKPGPQHAPAPAPDVKPAGHAAHTVLLVLATATENVPAAQRVHAATDVAAEAEDQLPGGQPTQGPPSGSEYRPDTHVIHAAAELCPRPSCAVPGGHAWQEALEVAPGTPLYLPIAHGVHEPVGSPVADQAPSGQHTELPALANELFAHGAQAELRAAPAMVPPVNTPV